MSFVMLTAALMYRKSPFCRVLLSNLDFNSENTLELVWNSITVDKWVKSDVIVIKHRSRYSDSKMYCTTLYQCVTQQQQHIFSWCKRQCCSPESSLEDILSDQNIIFIFAHCRMWILEKVVFEFLKTIFWGLGQLENVLVSEILCKFHYWIEEKYWVVGELQASQNCILV
jgi:hypothetical protein